VLRVGDHGGGRDALADPERVLGDDLVAHHAEDSRGDASADVAGVLVGEELLHAFPTSQYRAGPDYLRDVKPREGRAPHMGWRLINR
jgi:hypothetical protein